MRVVWTGLVLTVAVLIPNVGSAQVFRFRTPPPEVSAGGAEWQLNSEPIVVGGLTYYPTRGFRLFDGQVMAQAGSYERVPVYSDATMEPYLEVYVPSGQRQDAHLRTPTRPRGAGHNAAADLATELESKTCLFGPPDGPDVRSGRGRDSRHVRSPSIRLFRDSRSRSARITRPSSRPCRMRAMPMASGWSTRARVGTATGRRCRFRPTVLSRLAHIKGFPVYRDKILGGDDLWVAAVKDGPLAPYRRR